MEQTEHPLVPEQAEANSAACINCGSPNFLPGYPNKLCSPCRQQFIQYPVPLWIKLFAGGIGLIMIISFFNFLPGFSTGIHLERGKKAEAAHKYVSAQKEFEDVLARVPGNQEAETHLIVAALYNEDFETARKALNLMEGKNVDDEVLYAQVQKQMSKSSVYFSSDSMTALSGRFKDSIPEQELQQYIQHNPSDLSAAITYAARLFSKEDYKACEATLSKILEDNPDCVPALLLYSNSRRYQKDAIGAMFYLEQVLAIHAERVDALSMKARTFLMMKKDKEALEIAKYAASINDKDTYNLATLALAYHFNNDPKNRDLFLAKAKSGDAATYQYASDVINNKEKLRD